MITMGSLKLIDATGRVVSVSPEAIQAELTVLLAAVDRSCGESGSRPDQENLRRARSALMERLRKLR